MILNKDTATQNTPPQQEAVQPVVPEVPVATEEQQPHPTKKPNALFVIGIIVLIVATGVIIAITRQPTQTRNVEQNQGGIRGLLFRDVGQNNNGTNDVNGVESLSASNMVDTGQTGCCDSSQSIDCPSSSQSFFGQDAQYISSAPSYTDNGDGTVTDNVTGLMWQQDPGEKQEYYVAIKGVNNFSLAGYSDWRVPTIKELYSLIDFSGQDINSTASDGDNPFIDDSIFGFEYGDISAGDRIIDSQWVTSNIYEATVMGNQECFFGVNFADGRIKCYPTQSPRNNGYFAIYVRDGNNYGDNNFVDNGDDSITDNWSGLTWQQADSGKGMIWADALSYCENLSLADQNDWRLSNAKELEAIVDYSRSPDTTNSPAIDPIFNTSSITNEAGAKDYPFFWTSTTHKNQMGASSATYISFGRALGYMTEHGGWIDVHGAGAQRSDPKIGDPDDYPTGHGPQGDAIRIHNYVRCVRGGASASAETDPADNSSWSSGPSSGQQPGNQQQPTNGGGQDNSSMGPGNSGPGGAPPQEALTSCSNKTSGSSCSFSSPNGTITGTCQVTPDNQTACVPSFN